MIRDNGAIAGHVGATRTTLSIQGVQLLLLQLLCVLLLVNSSCRCRWRCLLERTRGQLSLVHARYTGTQDPSEAAYAQHELHEGTREIWPQWSVGLPRAEPDIDVGKLVDDRKQEKSTGSAIDEQEDANARSTVRAKL